MSIRDEVRAVVARRPTEPQCDAWLFGHDSELTSLLAQAGLIGITWPTEFGGRAASALDRLVVTEELLRVGAPVAAHWIADRQIGPAILRYGSPDLQRKYLRRIAAGESTFCLGMSETESGSDLAAVRTRAEPVEGGYRITGSKIWTSNAHLSTHVYVLARVPGGTDKHDGLTEFVVDLGSPGIEVRPILDLHGDHHFNETVFTDVFVEAGQVIGTVGNGWRQVTEQLSFERGGIERVLSTYPVLTSLLEGALVRPEHHRDAGALVARLHSLRGLAVGVATAVDAGEAPLRRAAMLKYLGTSFERELVDFGRDVLGRTPRPERSEADRLVAQGLLRGPGATLRGGTTEVLLDVLARQSAPSHADDELARFVDEAIADLAGAEKSADLDEIWARAVGLGWASVAVPEIEGGSGGELSDLACIVRGHARRGLSAPIAESALAARALRAGEPVRRRTLALRTDLRLDADGRLHGRCEQVPWVPFAEEAVLAADSEAGRVLVRVDLSAPGVRRAAFLDLAGEPNADLELDGVYVGADDRVTASVDGLAAAQLLLGSAAMLGAMEYAARLAVEHASTRTQFGKPLHAFQAVAHLLARMESEVELSAAGFELAVVELDSGGPGHRALAVHVQIADSATSVARIAHQVLGAMGMTHEHPLHRATLRLWAWRDTPAAAATIASDLGAAVVGAGPDALWEWLVHSTDALEAVQ